MNIVFPDEPATYPRPAESAWAAAVDTVPALPEDNDQSATDLTSAQIAFVNSEVGNDANDELDITLTLDSGKSIGRGMYAKIEIMSGSKSVATWWGEGNQTGTLEWSVSTAGLAAGEYTVKVSTTNNTKGSVESGKFTVVAGKENASWAGHKVELNQKADADGDFIFAESDSPVDFKVSKVLSIDEKTELAEGEDYVVRYYDVTKGAYTFAGTSSEGAAPTDAGSYRLEVWPTEDYADGAYANVTAPISYDFTISATAAKAYSFYQVNGDDLSDVSDTEFVYTGKDFTLDDDTDGALGLLIDGKKADTSKYKFAAGSDLKSAGTRTIEVQDAQTSKPVAYVEITIAPFDLSKATVVFDDVKADATAGIAKASKATLTYNDASIVVDFDDKGTASQVAGQTADSDAIAAQVVSFDAAKNSGAPVGYKGFFGYKGAYEVKLASNVVSSSNDKNPNFTGEANASVRVAADVAAGFKYDGTAFGSFSTPSTAKQINLADGQSFDPKDVEWTFDNNSWIGYGDSKGNATVTVYNADGEEVSAPTSTGLYTVVVSVNTGLSYGTAGTGMFYLNVVNGAGADIYMSFDGEIVANGADLERPETGSAYDFSVVVKAQDENKTILTEGKDYKVEIKDNDTNKLVDEIKSVGSYTVTVSSLGYNIGGASFDVTVNQGSFEGIEVEQSAFGWNPADYDGIVDSVFSDGDNADGSLTYVTGIPYTGKAVDVAVKAYNTKTVESEQVRVYTELDPSMYTVTFKYADGVNKGKIVKAEDLSKAGNYTATIELTDEFADKYDGVANRTADFSIVKNVVFMDVDSTDWYADTMAKAAGLGYMTGISGTQVSLAENNIIRADVATVLFRMAGGVEDSSKYPTRFSDVPEDAYFAQEVDWAFKSGIITGYDGTDLFGSYDMASREQIATMIYRFAKLQGKDVSVADADATLAKYADGSSVSEFAKTAVAYCVEAGIMGVDTDSLNPQGNATRAEFAAMAVRVAPAEEID